LLQGQSLRLVLQLDAATVEKQNPSKSNEKAVTGLVGEISSDNRNRRTASISSAAYPIPS
jgi:hypothetical protein